MTLNYLELGEQNKPCIIYINHFIVSGREPMNEYPDPESQGKLNLHINILIIVVRVLLIILSVL